MNKISVIIISKNEENRISSALESVKWADEIIVVDSGSADRTLDIAKKYTDKIFYRKFEDFSSQKNFAISKCNNRWVFSIDCDEVVTSALKEAIISAVNCPSYDAYRVKRVNRLFNRILSHSTGGDLPVRLFKKDRARFIQPIHEFLKVDGKTGSLDAELIHNTTQDMSSEYRKTDNYTELEAVWLLDRNIKPRLFKLIIYPALVFLRIYLIKKGFLDGLSGLAYAYASARYSFIKYQKARRLINDKDYLENKIANRFDEIHSQFPDSIDMTDLRLKALIENLGPLKNKFILELGCGKGRFTDAISRQGARCIGVDVSFNLVKDGIKKNNGILLLSSATEVCFKSGVFDAVFLVEVIEHIPNLDKLIQEAKRLLKPDGSIVIIDRNILSINNRRCFVPNIIIKKYHEIKNDWMYPKGFPYTERWFLASNIAEKLRRHFTDVKFGYILSDSEMNSKTWFLFKAVPVTRHFILWKAEGDNSYKVLPAPRAVIKEFGPEHMPVREKVTKVPLIEKGKKAAGSLPGIFCLRIDADEYDQVSFSRYYKLFERYKDAITIFFSINSFKNAGNEVMRCRDMGLDIQSHGFYHYTYNDYSSNRYNVKKAKDFLSALEIEVKGFASPMGKWNWQLMRALENEGYEYSSDFAYNYLGLPDYACYKNQVSRILQIPIFPVCPELFFRQKGYMFDDILNYYKSAIDQMIDCGIPVMIYAHTSLEHNRVPEILDNVAEYALSTKGLAFMSMTKINDYFRKESERIKNSDIIRLKVPSAAYLGKEISLPVYGRLKDYLKDIIDFERITPESDLQCNAVKKALKIFARKNLKENVS